MTRIEVGIITCDRYTHLAGLLSSLLFQTYIYWDVIIVDDSANPKDLREDIYFNWMFRLMEEKGHRWRVLFGPHKGSHHCHQIVLENSRHPLTLRLDDDHILEPEYLDWLAYYHINDVGGKLGATGGLVWLPNDKNRSLLPPDWDDRENYTGRVIIKDGRVGFGNSLQYAQHELEFMSEPKPTEHLIGAMLYKTEVGRKWGFNLDLSYVSRCEDDDFSYQFHVNGYKLFVIPQAIYWHFPEDKHGKIVKHSKEYEEMARSDRAIFESRVKRWNII